MLQNLKVTHYRNGDPIPNVTDNTEWSGLSTGAYCEYDNDIDNVATYGRLYNWYAIDDSRNIAPEGWHVPTDDEWKELEMSLGMSQAEADGENGRGTDEGGKLKISGTTHWLDPNTGATNISGFTALPGGLRFYMGGYLGLGTDAYFTPSTEGYPSNYLRYLYNTESRIFRGYGHIQNGVSVRCVKD